MCKIGFIVYQSVSFFSSANGVSTGQHDLFCTINYHAAYFFLLVFSFCFFSLSLSLFCWSRRIALFSFKGRWGRFFVVYLCVCAGALFTDWCVALRSKVVGAQAGITCAANPTIVKMQFNLSAHDTSFDTFSMSTWYDYFRPRFPKRITAASARHFVSRLRTGVVIFAPIRFRLFSPSRNNVHMLRTMLRPQNITPSPRLPRPQRRITAFEAHPDQWLLAEDTWKSYERFRIVFNRKLCAKFRVSSLQVQDWIQR